MPARALAILIKLKTVHASDNASAKDALYLVSYSMNLQYFGTCRIFDSLRILADKKKINMLPGFWGFSHSTKEVIQNIELCKLKKTPPKTDWELLNYKHLSHPRFKEESNLNICLDDAQILFIEIASLKTYRYKNFYTQSNRIGEAYQLPANNNTTSSVWMKSIDHCETSIQIDTAMLDSDELVDDINYIVNLLADKKIVFLNTFVIDDENSTKFSARQKIREALAVFQKEHSHVIHYDPSRFLEKLGNPIKDYAHYKPEFKPLLAHEFWKIIEKI